MHEISVVVFSRLRNNAYVNSQSEESFEDWNVRRCSESPTFFFWDLILRFQKMILVFVRAHRERNFNLYVCILEKLMPFIFSLDSTNYSRWLPCHLHDLKCLPNSVKAEFQNGLWTVARTSKKFSAIAIDHAHEQTNKDLKGSGGAMGLFNNEEALT